MNYRMIAYIIGHIVRIEALLMLPAMVCSFIYNESSWLAFLVPILAAAAVGTAITVRKPEDTRIFAKEGFVTVALAWIILSLFGAMPLTLAGKATYIDALFETVSGFTTTGASILSDVEAIGYGLLFWRSFTVWIGGVGVLMFVLAVLPQTDTSSVKMMHIMRAEVPGPKVGKLVSKISHTARITYGIYIALTLILFIMLLVGKMPLFDSITTALSAAGTGGFSVKNAGIAAYNSVYVEWVVGIFAMLFGINFNLYYFIIIGQGLQVLKSEETRWYLGIIAVASAIVTVDISGLYESAGESVRYAFFQVSSVITTAGFTTADFAEWPILSQTILLLLMFTGGCVGSTAGGLKVGRVLLLAKSGLREIKYMLHPRAVARVNLEGKPVEKEVVRSTMAYIIVYGMLFVASLFAFTVSENCDFVTSFTAVATCINNVGPGLGEIVGPMGGFGGFNDFTTILLTFVMLAGRLEIFPVIMLLSPATWRHR